MLYVFIVSSGSMMKFDMNLAVKKVRELKAEIERSLQIPSEDQVLLCSGGEELQEENIVGNYFGAGTDTNPIFLFRKYTNDCEYSYNVPLQTSIDLSIEDDVRGCANMAPSSSTATVRAALAQRFAEAAAKGRRECDELVHAQHLQQQGWAAVIANLEDGKDTLIKRKLHCEEVFQKYLAKRSHYQEIIKIFPEDIELLAKIPLLPKLLHGSELLDEALETEHTLLSWFCTEPRSFLDALVEKCQRSLEELNEHCLSALNEDVANVLKNADNLDIKEVKGIEERLSLLNKQIEDAKKLEKDQRDLATWFSCTQSRMTRDPGVLPDLCGTFQKQLLLMLENHKCLRDILERCTKAKLELSESINYRIKYISRVENEMFTLQYRINFLEKYVQSVSSQIENFHQVHLAPTRYVQLLAEVCRRKVFSSNFIKWASELSTQTFKLYQKEISIRQNFDSEDSRNMVDNLFPGMDDVPPPFAIECPRTFDQNLPNIMREDLDMLKIRLPELAHFCEVLAPDPMPYISQAESDSAFSSNIPSSRMVGDSADLGGRSQPEKGPTSPHKLAAPSGDYSSLPSEYASMPNEVFSLTSSPFEDPLLPNNQLDSALKRTKVPSSEVSVEKASSPVREIESDGEEFETVDRCGPSVEIRPRSSDRKRSASAPRPNSTSEVINININSADKGPKLAKARSDGDAISPIQERLKSSDSLLVSTDFQSTEYYIDDSMPSSYTESNATSPLLRGNRLVKSHHIVVAELQKQVEEKNGALVGATSSLKNSRSNILKLHAKISALQKFIQELQGSLHTDLSNLKAFVKEEFWERMAEVSQVVENINKTMAELQKQTVAEKEEALNRAKMAAESVEMTYLNQLEVQCQKLNDAESQITNYEDYIHQIMANLEEIKQEKGMLDSELSLKKEVIKSMMLEHELELDSLRNQMRQEIQARDDEIFKLKQNMTENESKMQCLVQQRDSLEEELKKQMKEKEAASSLLEQKETDFSERLKDMKQLQEEILRLQEEKDASKANPQNDEKLQSLQLELEQTRQKLSGLSVEMENSKMKELKDLEEKLTAQHRSDMESLRSRYKLAVSTTVIEKTSTGSPEGAKTEVELLSDDVLKILADNREIWEAEKEECIQALLQEQEKKCCEAVTEAVIRESAKFSAEKIKTIRSMRRECEENIEKSKSRLVAELQVSFNEAINSVTKEKDSLIETLRSKVTALEGSLFSVKFHIDKYSAEVMSETALSQSDSGASTSYKVLHRDDDRLLQKLKNEIEPFLLLSDHKGLPVASQEDESRSEHLKKNKLPGRSKVNTCIDCTYKISLLSCDVGDLILLCYEEKYDSFVAFHLGQFIHFLHPDSLQPLGLKIPAGPTEKWTLGVITNKEFCVARKPSNRYKMNVGTKFFRLKVMPWDKEKAIEEFHLHRSSHSSSRTASTPSSASEEGAKAPAMKWTFVGSLNGCGEYFSWEIDDIERLLTRSITLRSHRFKIGRHQWSLAMERGKTMEHRDTVQLFFRFEDSYSGLTPFVLLWNAAIVGREGLLHYTGHGQESVNIRYRGWKTVARWDGPAYDELFRTQYQRLLPGGKITIAIQISYDMVSTESTRKEPPVFSNVSMQTDIGDADGRMAGLASLGQNLKDLYLSGKDYDVTLKVSGKTFRAHKLVLGSRTPVLSAMFSHGMAEAETGVVCIEDCHPEAFEVFLMYVYSGVAENLSVENVIQVYYVADKYDLSGLREDCVRYMLSNMAIDCICSVLALATRHGEKGLLESATEFFVKKAEEISLTEGWSKFKVENSTLADDLIARSCGKIRTKSGPCTMI